MTLLIKNCRIISPDLDLDQAFISLDQGKISGVFPKDQPPKGADRVFDAKNLMAFPGFMDIHIHGAMGHDVTDGSLDAILAVAEAKLKEGVTTFCPTTLTLPEEALKKTMEALKAYNKDPGYARVCGVHLEGPYINPNCAGAQNPQHVRDPDMEEVKRLNAISKISRVSFAPEVKGGMEFARALKDAGIFGSCGHSNADYKQMRNAMDAGIRHLTHFCNQMTRLHHREVGLVGAGLLEDDLLIEMICDRIHLCEEMIRLAFKVKPIHRIALITDSMSASGLDEGDYNLGGLEVRVKDGAARLKSNNALAGSILKFNQALKNVYEITGLPLKELVKTSAYNQARALNVNGIGEIKPGFDGDIVLLDSEFEVKAVFVKGRQKL